MEYTGRVWTTRISAFGQTGTNDVYRRAHNQHRCDNKMSTILSTECASHVEITPCFQAISVKASNGKCATRYLNGMSLMTASVFSGTALRVQSTTPTNMYITFSSARREETVENHCKNFPDRAVSRPCDVIT